MSSTLRLLSLLATLAAAAVAAFAIPALSGADADSDQADGLETGVAGLAGWLGGLQAEGEFGKALPGLRTSTGAALNLGDAMGTLETQVQGLDAANVGDLATQLEGLSGEMADAQVTLQTANVDATGPVVGFDLTVTAERTVENAKLALKAPAANGAPEVSLGKEDDTQGVPLDSTLTAIFNVRWDADRSAFHVDSSDGGSPSDASDDTPKVSAAATVADYAFPAGFRTAIGFGDVDVADGSSFDLAASILADVLDPNGDGRVAFEEPGNPEGDNQLIPAELSLPASQILTAARSGTADVALNLDSPFTATDDDANLNLAGPDLSQAPTTTVTGDDVDELANFDNVEAVEVLSGLAQYATAIRALQSNPNVDAELPFMSGRLSDVLHVEKAVADFVDAHTQDVSPGQDIEDVADFRTVDGLARAMDSGAEADQLAGLQDTNGGTANKLSPVYDPATDKLTFDLQIASKPLSEATEEAMPQPPAPDSGQVTPVNQANEIGLPQIGGELAALTGISSVGPATTDPHSEAKRKTAFTVKLPFVIDLRDATPREDDPDTDGIEEFESPMPNERYRVGLGGTNEIETTQEVRTPVTGKGVIGFVGFDVADSNLALTRADSGQPMLKVDALPAKVEDLPAEAATGGDDRAISTLLKQLSNQTETTDDDPVAPAQPNWRLDGVLREDARGPGVGADDYRLTAERGKIDIHWANPNQPIGASDVTLDDTAVMLKALNIAPPNPTPQDPDDEGEPAALMGKTLDQAGELLEGINGVFSDKPLLDRDVPFLGASARDLFAAGQTLQDKIDAVRQNPPATLQDLEVALQDLVGDELGLSASARRTLLKFSLKNLGGGDPELITRLGFEQTTSEDRPVNLGVDALGVSIAGAADGGTIQVEGLTDFDLAFPITLNGDAPQPRILDSSGFSVAAGAADTTGATELVASVGGLGVRLGDSAARSGRFGAGVKFSAYPDGTQVPEASEQPVSLSNFITSLQPDVGSSNDSGFNCDLPDPNADDEPPAPPTGVDGELLCLAAPVFLKTGNVYTPVNGGDPLEADNYLIVTMGEDLSPSITLPTGLDPAAIAAQLLNFDSFKDGFAKLQAILELALQGATYGEKLPLIGDQIAAGAKVLDPIRKLADDLESIVVEADKPVTEVNELIRQKVFDALDQLPVKFLRDSEYGAAGVFPGDADSDPSPTDIRVLMLCGDDKHLCDASETMTDLSDVSLDLELGSGNATDCVASGGDACKDTKTLPLDFGIPGLNLQGPGTGVEPLSASAGWSLGLGFGVSKAGFYLKDNPLPGDGQADADDAKPELDVGFRVGLTKQADDPELEGRIGFLDIEMEDGDDQSNINAGFKTNLTNGGGTPVCDAVLNTHCSRNIDIAQLPGLNVADLLVPTFGGDLDVDLKLTTGVDTGSDTDEIAEKLPKITTDFIFTWGFDQDSITDLEPPTIEFKNVAIDPGTLFSATLNPIFEGLQRFTKPVEPIREFIFAPIPIISDLSRLFGGGDVSFVDLAEIFGDVDLALLKDINGLLDFVDNLPTAAGEGIVIGDFRVPGAQATGAPITPDQAQGVAEELTSIPGDLLTKAQDKIGDSTQKEAMKSLVKGDSGAGNADSTKDITVPILEQPDCVFGMLIGGDCDLFRYRPDPFRVRFDYEQAFGPFFGVLYVTVGGYAGAGGRLDIGYDTKGLRMLIQDIQAGTATPGDAAEGILEGVFLGDLDENGQDVNELEVQAGITAGAKLSVVLAELGARGGIDATVGLNLHDGPDIDGKLRISEIKRKLAVPWCLFDVTGRLSAFLEAYAKLGVGPFSVEKTFELARIVLLDFSEGCPETEPVLATALADQVLRLNIGTDDGARNGDGPGWTNAELDNDGNESFVVRQTGPSSVSVTAFGFTKKYDNVASILVNDAGNGDDSLLFQGLKAGGQGGESTAGTPGATADFSLPVKASSLGSGEDTITTGSGGDEVHGGSEGDTINLGAGDDDGFGDGGNDTISGAGGTDDISGGADGDNLDGGLGEDTVNGDGGNDRIDGGRDLVGPGSGLSVEEGTDVGDVLIGGADADEIDGGSGEDEIHGDEELSDDSDGDASGGNDVLAGGLDKDTVYAGNGDDTVFGGLSDETNPDLPVDTAGDELHGNGAADTIHGGEGADKIWGGSGDDKGFGDQAADVIRGQGDEDVLRGASGEDEIHGGGGDDEVFGESDDDDLFGNGDVDLVMGAGGDDDIDGGSGDDRQDDGGGLFGDDGDDDIRGNTGSDDLFGGSGEDVEVGDEGTIAADRSVSLQEDDGAADRLFGDNDDDRMYGEGGNDELRGGPDADLQFGNGGDDLVLGQTGTDRLIGGSARDDAPDLGDDVFGGTENDVLLGDNGTIDADGTFVLGPTGIAGAFGGDIMNGGPGDDVMHGQDGVDTMYGAEDRDLMFGDLDGDTMFGQSGQDHMLGDQGTVQLTGGVNPGGSQKADVLLQDPADGGEDTMDGGSEDDGMYGGAATDTMSGGFADDHMEGNDGQDKMYGASKTANDGLVQATDAADALLDGQDDMIGGSSHVNPLTIKADEGEIEMRGDGAQDVMTGDNAVITRHADEAGTAWLIDNITGGVARDVELLDTEKTGADLLPVGGADTMLGNDGNDRMYGESDTDTVKGNAHEDYLEGNQDRDWVEGNGGQDDLIGGSAVGAQPDDGDYLHGGGEADVVTGDNAVITRDESNPGGPYSYVVDRLEVPTNRYVKLLDQDNAQFAEAAGPDQVSGGAGVDVLFGQDEPDWISGGSEDDYMEGNGDIDREYGDDLLSEVDGVPPVIAALAGSASAEPELSGVQGADGQDEQVGGSSVKAHRDDKDYQYGNGASDVQIGDNGEILRRFNEARTAYLFYEDANPTTLQRQVNRYDVGGADSASGPDEQYGEGGDDYQYGQDDDDLQRGGPDNDVQYGELGQDRMFGEAGEDAMVGDRGLVTDDRILADDADDEKQFTVTTVGPMFNSYTAFRPGTLHRYVDLLKDGDGDMDGDGDPVEKPGLTVGQGDTMRGGPDRDSMHGAFGDDIANGDSGGDIVYGDDGSDALWGGRGSTDPANAADRGVDDSLVDYVFGGHGGAKNQGAGIITGGADVIDYRPRPGIDPAEWFAATETGDADVANNQHHQGVDWIYGGWDRDVMQGDIGDNGPDKGDRLMDWTGAYNLYTHCHASYGDDQDVRQISPGMLDFLEKLAFGTGVGTSLTEVQTKGSSAYRELALVYTADVKHNAGKAYPTTPGHFESTACLP